MVRSRWMMWLVSQSLVWTDFPCIFDIGMKLFVFIYIVVYNSGTTISLLYGILAFNYLSLSDFISCVFMRIPISIVLIDGESECVVFWIRLFMIGSWVVWLVVNGGMIRSGGRMDRHWMGSYDRSVVRGGCRGVVRSRGWGM